MTANGHVSYLKVKSSPPPMDKCDIRGVTVTKAVFSQWLVMTPLILHHLAIGFVLGYPAILTPAITGNSTSDVHATKGEASWIAAAYGMTGSIGFLTLPGLMQVYGRRFVNIALNTLVCVGSIIIALAPNVPMLIAGRAIQGIAFGGLYIGSILASEYAHPKRRGFFVVFKITASCIGVLICHSLGFTLSWRQVAWLGAIPPALAVAGTTFWPESPSWLAYKGRYEESVAAFEWLRGKDLQANKEIKQVLIVQHEIRKHRKDLKGIKIQNAVFTKEFLKPFNIVTHLVIISQVCGRHYLLAYVVQIMVELTGDTTKAYYYTIGLDAMKILAILASSIAVRLFNRRTLIFYSGAMSCVLLTLVSIIQCLDYNGIIKAKWLTPSLLILYNFVCHVGVIPLTIVIKGEMFPLQFKGLGTCVTGIIYSLTSMLTLKFTSIMLDVLKAHGTLAVYDGLAIILLISLYFILPETKDRTLQDIESEFINIKVNKELDEVMSKLVK